MTMFTCSECSTTKTKGYVRKCNKCGRILCDACKGALSACKDSKRAKADCRGMFLRPFVPQM
jgi:hypothetical protein